MQTLKNLSGPVYHIDNQHHFNEFEKQVKGLMKLEGPVYTIDRQHHYNEILKEVSGIQKSLVGPVFKIDRKHGYAEVPDVVPKVGDLAGMIGFNIDALKDLTIVNFLIFS